MITEAIILAGGLGTRLRSAVPDLPKCMAPVAGKPFLDYVITHFQTQGILHFIFALGYKHEVITRHIIDQFPDMEPEFSIEDTPLGTGGAIRKACEKSKTDDVLVVNGDTLFKVNLAALSQTHLSHGSECTLSLKPMRHMDRYGVVELDEHLAVQHFLEKKYYDFGWINGGVYALKRKPFISMEYPDAFSFEKEYLERYAGKKAFYGHRDDGYFIDIGIPDDYERAQKELGIV